MDAKKIVLVVFVALLLPFMAHATQEQVRVTLNEYVDEKISYNPLGNTAGLWTDADENRSVYNGTGYIVITNENPNGKTISDIYVSFDYTTNMSMPTLFDGRNGSIEEIDLANNLLILHVPELQAGQNSTWMYSINTTNVRPPLNFSTEYSDTKILAGDSLFINDTIENTFVNAPYQTNTCIENISITGVTVPVNFSGVDQDFLYEPSTLGGTDSSNVTFANANRELQWSVLGGGCLTSGATTDISYNVSTPLNIPSTQVYPFINTTIEYQLNQTQSQLRVIDITAVSEAQLDFEKRIVGPSDPILYGSNVTWNVTGYFRTNTNITYNLTKSTFWVSQRNVNGSYTDLNTIDNDPIGGNPLNITYNPGVLVNFSSPWTSPTWLFNYSDMPTPIVWMKNNFSIHDDGTQLVNRSYTRNGNDIYIKELYLIIGYWLEVEKNITSLGNDSYNIRIDVHNKGNQVTPADSIVTIYDFIPEEFNVTGAFSYSNSPWYTTAEAQTNVSGQFNGTLMQWGLTPQTTLNTSFAQGPAQNENTTWYTEYNVSGQGDYQLIDAFVTGLDPQQVDGAGASQSTVVTEVIERVSSTEGWFALTAGVLLLFGLLL